MHRIGYLLSDDFQVLSLATQTVFEYANIVAEAPFYSIEFFSVAGGIVRSKKRFDILSKLIVPAASLFHKTAALDRRQTHCLLKNLAIGLELFAGHGWSPLDSARKAGKPPGCFCLHAGIFYEFGPSPRSHSRRSHARA